MNEVLKEFQKYFNLREVVSKKVYDRYGQQEVWLPIIGYEGRYEVSNYARVRSVVRKVRCVHDGKDYSRNIGGKIISQSTGATGYYRVRLFKNHTESETLLVHRLVAEAFIPNPDNLPEVNHKDECKTNNILTNLEWCDKKYNINYGTGKYRSRDARSKRIEQLTLDGLHVAFYPSIREAARVIKCTFSDLQKAVHETYRVCKGYHWRLTNE